VQHVLQVKRQQEDERGSRREDDQRGEVAPLHRGLGQDVQRYERGLGAQFDQPERCEERHTADQRVEVPVSDAEGEGEKAEGHRDRARHVELDPRGGTARAHHERRHGEYEHGDRHVDEERPMPAQGAHEGPA